MLAKQDSIGPFSRTMAVLEELGYYETCNIGYRRSVLEGLDGFDEQFRHPFGEDTDLAWRAREGGATTRFAPEALVYHEVWPGTLRSTLRDLRRREGIVQCAQRHPTARPLPGPILLHGRAQAGTRCRCWRRGAPHAAHVDHPVARGDRTGDAIPALPDTSRSNANRPAVVATVLPACLA